MPTFANGETNTAVRTKINDAITLIDGFSTSFAQAEASAASAVASAAAAGAASGRLDVGSFTQLNTKFNYTGLSGRELAAEGDIILWRETGFAYEVLAAGASGAHLDYTGSGGVKLTILSDAGGAVSPLQIAVNNPGVTDMRASLQSTFDLSETVILPSEQVNIGGGVLVNRSTTLRGTSGSELHVTGVSGSSVPLAFGGVTYNGTPRPAFPGTIYNMGSGAISSGTNSFTFVSVAGLAVGDEVLLMLGLDPTDNGQTHVRIYTTVNTIVGLTVTFTSFVPYNIAAFPGSPAWVFAPTFHECIKFTDGMVDAVIDNLTMTQDIGPAYDRVLRFDRCRTVVADNLRFKEILNGLYIGECGKVSIGSIHTDICRNSLFGLYGTENATIKSLTCSALIGNGFYVESNAKNFHLENLYLRGHPSKTTTTYVFIGGRSSGTIDNLDIDGPAYVSAAIGLTVDTGSTLAVRTARIGTGINTFPLRYVTEKLHYAERDYSFTKRWRLVVPIQQSMSAVSFNLPDGLHKSLRGSISNKTGITLVRMKNNNYSRDLIDTGNTVDFFPTAGTFGDITNESFTSIGSDTAEYAVNADPEGQRVEITTSGSAVEGSILILEGETFILTDDSIKGDFFAHNRASLTGLKTLNFVAPGAVPGSPADQTITVTGAALGDKVTVSAPVTLPAGFILQGFVSAADTVSVRWTQVSGVADDPDGSGGIYRVDVFK